MRERITAAARAAGRDPSSVTLVGVGKSQPIEHVKSALAAGLADLGENYVQEARAHFEALAGFAFRRHFIGALQTNKTREAATLFDWVHTVDRIRVAERLSAQRPPALPPLAVCIQVQLGGESTKSGVAPRALAALAGEVAALPRTVVARPHGAAAGGNRPRAPAALVCGAARAARGPERRGPPTRCAVHGHERRLRGRDRRRRDARSRRYIDLRRSTVTAAGRAH